MRFGIKMGESRGRVVQKSTGAFFLGVREEMNAIFLRDLAN